MHHYIHFSGEFFIKIFANAQDIEDYEQEKLIQGWLNENQKSGDFTFTSINSKGNLRHTGDYGSFSLDQKISSESTGNNTFSDIIGGYENGDLFDGKRIVSNDSIEFDQEERIKLYLDSFLNFLGVNMEAKKWIMNSWKSKANKIK